MEGVQAVDGQAAVTARRLVRVLGGRFSLELGIDLDHGPDEVERWFLAATLFGRPGARVRGSRGDAVTGRKAAVGSPLLAVAVAAIVLGAIGGCGLSDLAPGAGGSPGASGSPVAASSLDRVLTDDDEQRARRDELVDGRVAAVVDDARVVAAMRAVPRHCFVPTGEVGSAYQDHPLPIGLGQTISQPSLVGMMTELLDLQPGDRVLEVGTGSGYQAAILRELTDEVYSVEIIPELAATARAVLDALGYGDIRTDRRDGYFGWPEHAPYDAIIVTAAPDHLPSPLVDQLSPDGGRMVIPIGPPGDVQVLWLVTREGDETRMERLIDVAFVPLTRESP